MRLHTYTCMWNALGRMEQLASSFIFIQCSTHGNSRAVPCMFTSTFLLPQDFLGASFFNQGHSALNPSLLGCMGFLSWSLQFGSFVRLEAVCSSYSWSSVLLPIANCHGQQQRQLFWGPFGWKERELLALCCHLGWLLAGNIPTVSSHASPTPQWSGFLLVSWRVLREYIH